MHTLTLSRRAAGVAQLTMNRPSVHNAFDEVMVAELTSAFAALVDDAQVRLIVLAGAGRHFSAGADLQWMQRASQADEDWNRRDAQRFAEMLACIQTCPKPVLARVQGAALGGGTGLVAACDIAIASDKARFAASEVRFGILPAVIGPYLVNAIGRRQAQRLALLGAPIDAEQALALGLVHQLVPADDDLAALDAAVDATLAALLQGGPEAQREVKRLYAQLTPGPVDAALRELSAATIARVRQSDEARAGIAAFLSKQPAPWLLPD